MPETVAFPAERSTTEVLDLIKSSSGAQWVYFPDERILSFRNDLLVRIEGASNQPDEHFVVFYGNRSLGNVLVKADWENAARTGRLAEVSVSGDLTVNLQGVDIGHSKLNNEEPSLAHA